MLEEIEWLDFELCGFLLFFEYINVLILEICEMVIDCVMGLEIDEFEFDDLKWIILMVLFNVLGNENVYIVMEELLYSKE